MPTGGDRVGMVVSLRMRWQDLLFVNYPLDPARLRPLVPSDLTIDPHRGDAWVSVIPFVNRALRPAGFPERLGIRLPELNVRTYVRHDGTAAVYFFSLDADSLVSVIGARLFHDLPYYFADVAMDRSDGAISFESRRRHPGARPGRFRGRYRPTGDTFPATERPLTSFLFERYRFYTEDTYGRIRYTDVSHEPWSVAKAEASIEVETVRAASGIPESDGAPTLHYSPGVDVRASPSRRG